MTYCFTIWFSRIAPIRHDNTPFMEIICGLNFSHSHLPNKENSRRGSIHTSNGIGGAWASLVQSTIIAFDLKPLLGKVRQTNLSQPEEESMQHTNRPKKPSQRLLVLSFSIKSRFPVHLTMYSFHIIIEHLCFSQTWRASDIYLERCYCHPNDFFKTALGSLPLPHTGCMMQNDPIPF